MRVILTRSPARGALPLAIACWLAVVGAVAWFLADSQASSRSLIRQRLQSRTQLGSEFVSLYVDDLLVHEREEATSWLGGPRVTGQTFAHAASSFGLNAAVLLDSQGRLLAIVPPSPKLLGQPLSRKYVHLAEAVAGHEAVSDVVPSAADGVPVVAFAVPFPSTAGRRVFSGAYEIARTPLGAYLSHMINTPGHEVYLVDGEGRLIASSGPRLTRVRSLAQADRRLAAAALRHHSGVYDSGKGSQYFVTSRIGGTPWQIVVRVPSAQLYSTLDLTSRWLAWVALAGFGLAGLAVIVLITGLHRSRMRLAVVNAKLDRLARVDVLTGLKNRRAIDESLQSALSAAKRHCLSLSVLMVDVDHFKQLNDTLGHGSGDAVLAHIARVLESELRVEDEIGRWGGEEFLVILPATDEVGAINVAERLRAQVAKLQSGTATTLGSPVTITVGVAEWSSENAEQLVASADAALYSGKLAGRNTVRSSAGASELLSAG